MAAQLPIISYNNKTLIMYTMECLVEKVFKGENKVILTKKNYLKVCKEMGWAISYLRGAARKFTFTL